MFLHVSVILLTGGVVSGEPPRDQAENPPTRDQADTPLGPGRYPPLRPRRTPHGRENPPRGPGRHPPAPGRENRPHPRDQADTVNERPVRILLECILVTSTCALCKVLECYECIKAAMKQESCICGFPYRYRL